MEFNMRNRWLYLCLFVFIQSIISGAVYGRQAQHEIMPPGTVIASLEEGYVYGPFTANDEYIAWFNLILKKLYIWQETTGDIKEISLREGRGPGEIIVPMSIISDSNSVALLDPNLAKIVRIDISTEKKEDIPTEFGVQDFMTMYGGKIYLMNARHPEKMFYQFDADNREAIPFDLSGLNLLKEFKNIFFKQGTILANQDYVLLSTKYRPFIYLLDRQRLQFTGKFEWDISEVEVSEPQKMESGAAFFLPPSKVNILTEGAAIVPGNPDHIFIIARGKGRSRSYTMDTIYEFSLKTRTFVTAHNLSIKATRIFSDNRYLYVYSEEESKIFRYDITGR